MSSNQIFGITLTGFSLAGKSTIASILRNKLEGKGIPTKEIPLADVLKKLMAKKYSLPLVCFYESKDQIIEELGKTPRELLIEESAAVKKDESPGYFAERALKEMKPGINIFPDVRFRAELVSICKKLRDKTFKIRIIRKGVNRNDGSETAFMTDVSIYDYWFFNDEEGLEKLEKSVEDLVDKVIIPWTKDQAVEE